VSGQPKFVIYNDESSGEQPWRWRLKAGNGEIVASGESFRDVTDTRRAIEQVCRSVAQVNPLIEVIEAEHTGGKVPRRSVPIEEAESGE
jgi:uncharacterized protein YegP (UPF0339 family)